MNIEYRATDRTRREVMLGGILGAVGGPTTSMPLYIDIHRNVEADASAVVEAHERDIEVQEHHDVNYQRYWIDEDEGVVFCLFEGPNKAAGEQVHREAHGLLADEIYEVTEGA